MMTRLSCSLVFSACVLFACAESTTPDPVGGETHFLQSCDTDAACGLGLECVCAMSDGRQLVKRVIAGSRRGLYTLLSHNDEPIIDVQLITAAPVLWVKRSLRR